MSKKSIVHFVLVLSLAVASLAALLGLLAGTQGQVYAAFSQPANRERSLHFAPPPEPAAATAAAPLLNGWASVITVCKSSCPYTSVQAAVNASASGGIVKVAQGTYTDTDGSYGVVYITQTLTLRGGYTITDWSTFDPVANPTILDGKGSSRVLMTRAGMSPTIEGFHIVSGSGSLGSGAYIGSGTTLRRNRIYYNAADRGGGVYIFGGSPTLVNNFIYSNTVTGSVINGNGGGVYVNGTPLLHHNTLYDNQADNNGGGIYINTESGAAPIISATIVVSNTALAGGGIYGSGGRLNYNDVWGNSGGNYGGGASAGSNSISANPLFEDPSGLDLRIQAGSPCREQVPLAQMAEADYWDLVRPFGDQADIGAHEFYPSLTCLARISSGQVYSTVQTAVSKAPAGSLVKVAGRCTGVEFTGGLSQTVYISQALTLRGGYTLTWSAPDPDVYTTVLDALGQGRVIYVSSADAVEVEGFLMRGGFITGDGGGIRLAGGGDHLLQDNKIYSNTAGGAGGGVYVTGGDPAIQGNEIYSNTANGGNGGGVYVYVTGGDPAIQGNEIYSNTANGGNGGGVYVTGGDPVIQGNEIYSNTVGGDGGGVYVTGGDPAIQGNEIYTNTAGNYGGGFYIAPSDSAVVWNNNIYSNTAVKRGGGGYVASGSPTIKDNQIYGNQVTEADTTNGGGGLYIEKDSSQVWDNYIHDNFVYGYGGGGIFINAGNSTIRGNLIYSNTQQNTGNNQNGGGGVYVYQGSPTIEGNDIYANSASGSYSPPGGGGLYVEDGTPTIKNNLIHSNTVGTDNAGGGILIYGGSPIIDSNTIYSNLAGNSGSGGGGIYNNSSSSSVIVRNNIIVNNTNEGVNGAVGITVYYSDIWGNSGGNCIGSITCNSSDGNISLDPKFETPGSDFYLKSDSPCIDAADPNNYPAIDHDGRARPFGAAPDMGAYEFYYTGTCFAQIDDATRVYTVVQTAINTATTSVRVSGICTETVEITRPLIFQGGYDITASVEISSGLWVTPAVQTILDGGGSGPVVSVSTDTVTVERFIIRNGSGGGISVTQSLSPTVQNVILHSNQGGGFVSAGGNPRLYNDTVVSNTGIGLYFAAGNPVISNTIIVSNTGDSISTTASIILYYSDVRGNGGCDWSCSNLYQGTGSFSADPLFDDFAGYDFHLSLHSPCVHTADPGTGLVWDLEGDVRPSGRGSDIGADEAAIYADVVLAPYSWLSGIPSQPVVHPHILTNTGSISDTFNLTHTLITSDSLVWDVSYTPVFTLDAGEAAEVPVTVIIPDEAVSGTVATVIITATSTANDVIYDVVSNTTMANLNPGVEFTPVYSRNVNPGTVITYEHTLTNTGNAPDTFAITYADVHGWTTSVTPTSITDLGSYQAATVWVRVEIPGKAPGGLVETTIITAASASSGAQAVVTDTTEVNLTTGDRYVAKTGDDTLNNCLVSTEPCLTIAHAVDQALAGDTIKVAEGTYAEYNIGVDKEITLRGGYTTTVPNAWSVFDPNHYETIVDAGGAGRVFAVSGFGSPTIEGFTIKGGNTAGSGGGILVNSFGSPIIRQNVILNNTAGSAGGGIYNASGGSIVEQNEFRSNSAPQGAAFSSADGKVGFWNNMVYDNIASAKGGGVYVSGGNARIWNDTIYSNTAERGGGIYLAGGSPVVSNTIVVKNTATITGGGIHNAVGAVMDYNDVWNNTNANYVGASAGSNSIMQDPKFWNEPMLDLHLDSSSPCRNAGDATSVAEDFDGEPRKLGPATDMGADEFMDIGVDLEPDNSGGGLSGTTVNYNHTVTNTGNYTATFTIEASSSHNWSVTTPADVQVGPGQAEGIVTSVDIPGDAIAGTIDTMVVTATSDLRSDIYDTAVDTTTVALRCGLEWDGVLTHRFISNTTGVFWHTLKNTGNLTDTFDITWSWSDGDWNTDVNPDPVTLGPGEQTSVQFTVTIPINSNPGNVMVNHLTVTATASYCGNHSVIEPVLIIDQDPGLELAADESDTDKPNNVIRYTHILTNTGNYYDTISMTWQTDPDWTVALSADEISLASGASTTFTVDVTIPDGATCDMTNTTIIAATSFAGAYKGIIVSKSVTDTTGVEYEPDVEFTPDRTANVSSDPSQQVTVTYTHRLTNTGNCGSQFGLTARSSQGFTVTTVPSSSFFLDHGASRDVTVTITVPPNGTNLLVDTTVITAYHWGHQTDRPVDAIVDTTIVNQAAGVTLEPDNTGVVTRAATSDVQLQYTHTLTNDGNYTDTFNLTGQNENSWPVKIKGQTPPVAVMVGSGYTATITVEVTVPWNVYTITNRTVITAASQFSPTVTATAVNTTSVRRPGVLLWPNYDQDITPGDVITHTHSLTNTGGISSSYVITYHSMMGWAVDVTPTQVTDLLPGSGVPVTAIITVPTGADILSGTRDILFITATSQITDIVYDTAVDTSTVPYIPGVLITPNPANGHTMPSVQINYTHTLTNTGNYTESFDLTTGDNADVNPKHIYNLGPGKAYTVTVYVAPPQYAAAGETMDTQMPVSFAGEVNVVHDHTYVDWISGTRYVEQTSGTDDNNNCRFIVGYGPCATLQQAVYQAMSGDEVHVAQGVYTDVQTTSGYTEAVYVDKSIALFGGYDAGDWSATPDPVNNETVLDAGGQGRVIYVATGVTPTIEGFHLRHGFVEGDGAGIYVASGAAPTVRRNRIYSNTATGEGRGGGVYYGYTGGDADLILERNIVYSNTAESEGGGFYVYGSYSSSSNQQVWNNLFYHNSAEIGGGLYLRGDDVTVWNNTFYSNTAYSSTVGGGGIYIFDGSPAISNTILANNARYGIYKRNGSPTTVYNLVWDNSPTNFYAVSPGSGTITTTPGFVDAAGGDLHLRIDSAAINAGAPGVSLPDDDLDGNARPLSGRHDIGAYENGLMANKIATGDAPAGGTITYTIVITNAGAASRSIVVTDTLHHYLEYIGLNSTPSGNSSHSDPTASWQGTVPSDTTALITITATLSDVLGSGTPITNVAYIDGVPTSVVTTTVAESPGPRYVAQTGSNMLGGIENSCKQPDQPCRTIQYAAERAMAGDEVRVASGTYTDTLSAGQVVSASDNITLTGGYTPTLPTWTYAPNVYTTTLDAKGYVGVLITGSATVTVNSLHIISGSVGIHVASGDLTLARSWIYNNDDGVDVISGTYMLVNNVVAHNSGAGVRAANGSVGSLLHNTFARNATAGVIVSGTARFTNTVFYSHSVGINAVAPATAYLSNTLWCSNTTNLGSSVISSTNWFNQDPRFTNSDGMDYHVRPGSSVIDKGLDTWVSDDIDSEHRPLLQHPDLGADEFAVITAKYGPPTADPDQIITYTITLQGGGNDLVLTDTLHSHLTYTGTVSCSSGDCGYLAAQRAITWTGDAPEDQPVYITYTAQVTSWLAPGTQILNDALVRIGGNDYNTGQATTTINDVSGTRYVDAATGVDSDGGTGNNCLAQWKPCATVQYAVDLAHTGDGVRVASGTYTDTLGAGQVVSVSKSITLTGGYVTPNWLTSDPETHPTLLDSQSSGRAMVITGTVDVTIDGFHLLNGSVNKDGAGLYIDGGATVTLLNSWVYNNVTNGSGHQGGGIYANSSNLTITATQVYSNTSNNSTGGGIYHTGSVFALYDSWVYSNTASESGGGLYLSNADVILTDNHIYTNTSNNSYGGGLRIFDGYNTLMERNVILDNQADKGGGASIDLRSTTRITMTNNIIGSNHANSGGDGLFFAGYGSGLLLHNTIADNDGQGIRVNDFDLAMTNTILSGHSVGITTTAGAAVTADHTLLNSGDTYTNTTSGGSITTTNTVIGSPGYRNQAAMDYHIAGGSAAIEAGIDAGVSTDIDGETRTSPPDIGADQYNLLNTDRWVSSTDLAPCQTMTHTLVITNVSDSPVSGIVLTDTLTDVTYAGFITYTAGNGGYLASSQAITWSGDISSGNSVYITYTANVNPRLADGTVISFTASIQDSSSVFLGDPLTVTVHTITATVSKEGEGSISPAGQATIGELVTYTVVYTVPAGHETINPLVVDELPQLATTPAMTYVVNSLSIGNATMQTEAVSADGGTITWTLDTVTATCGVPTVATLTFNARVLNLSGNDAGDVLTNTVTISYTDGMSHRVINAEQALTLIEPGLTLTHTTAATYNLGTGDLVVVAITATNPGNTTLYDVVVTDTLGSGWVVSATGGSVFTHTFSNIDAGNSSMTSFTARVHDDVGANVTLTATVEGRGSSMPGAVNEKRIYTNTAPVVATTGYPNLVLDKDGPTACSPGLPITYTIRYTNTGAVRAVGVQITDTLPLSLTNVISATSAGATVERVGKTITWTLTAPVSRSINGRIWITVTIPTMIQGGTGYIPMSEGTVLTNTAGLVVITTTEMITTDNNDQVATTVQLPSLSITKTVEPASVLPNGLLTYTLTVSNTGLGDATGLVISDSVPSNTSYQSCADRDGCDESSGVVTWTLALLPAGERVAVTFTVQVGDIPFGTTILNETYDVASAQGVTATGKSVSATVELVRGLSLTPPTQDKSVMPSERAVYTHTLTNQGNVTATFDLAVSDAPSGWTYTLSPSGAGAVADLAPNGSALITLTVQAPAGTGSATALITATWQGASGVYATAVDTATIGCVPVSGVSIEYSPTAPRIGQTVTFTGTASGTAPLSYAWSFDDGSNDENGQSVTHVYNDAGSYNVQLTVTNCGGGFSDSDTQNVIVNPYNIYLPLVLRNF